MLLPIAAASMFVFMHFVVYFKKRQEWIVMKVEHFLSLRIEKERLIFDYWKEVESVLEGEEQGEKKGMVKTLSFANLYEGDFNQ